MRITIQKTKSQLGIIDTTQATTKTTATYYWDATNSAYIDPQTASQWMNVAYLIIVDADLTAQELDEVMEAAHNSAARNL